MGRENAFEIDKSWHFPDERRVHPTDKWLEMKMDGELFRIVVNDEAIVVRKNFYRDCFSESWILWSYRNYLLWSLWIGQDSCFLHIQRFLLCKFTNFSELLFFIAFTLWICYYESFQKLYHHSINHFTYCSLVNSLSSFW